MGRRCRVEILGLCTLCRGGLGLWVQYVRRAALMGVVYVIFEGFADPMRFPKMLLYKAGLPGNYEKKSLQAFI